MCNLDEASRRARRDEVLVIQYVDGCFDAYCYEHCCAYCCLLHSFPDKLREARRRIPMMMVMMMMAY